MRSSLKRRLLVWHSSIVVAVIITFGGAVCALAWRAGLADIDDLLESRATDLVAGLSRSSDGAFDLALVPDTANNDTVGLYHALWGPDGSIIDLSDPELAPSEPPSPGAHTREGRRELVTRTTDGATVLVGRPLVELSQSVWTLAGLLAAVGVAALALSLASGWTLVGRALSPIGRIALTARNMTAGDLDARIPVARVETEFEEVARALNGAFDRLQASLDRQRKLTADVSHELRTPLATALTEIQWALSRPRTVDEYRESLAVCKRASERMEAIVERLLALARAEAVQEETPLVDVRLDTLLDTALDDLAPLAADRRVTVHTQTDALSVTGNPERLREAFTNVLVNAIRYNVEGGSIDVTMTREAGTAGVFIADSGVGIAASDIPRIFDPFFRADPARARDAGGAGLGLAVARAIIEQHGGSIACRSEAGRGTTITIELPLAASEALPERQTHTGVS